MTAVYTSSFETLRKTGCFEEIGAWLTEHLHHFRMNSKLGRQQVNLPKSNVRIIYASYDASIARKFSYDWPGETCGGYLIEIRSTFGIFLDGLREALANTPFSVVHANSRYGYEFSLVIIDRDFPNLAVARKLAGNLDFSDRGRQL